MWWSGRCMYFCYSAYLVLACVEVIATVIRIIVNRVCIACTRDEFAKRKSNFFFRNTIFQLVWIHRTWGMWPKIVYRPRYMPWSTIFSRRTRLDCQEHQFRTHLMCRMCRNQSEWAHWRWKTQKRTDCPSFASKVLCWMSTNWWYTSRVFRTYIELAQWNAFSRALPGECGNSIGRYVGQR